MTCCREALFQSARMRENIRDYLLARFALVGRNVVAAVQRTGARGAERTREVCWGAGGDWTRREFVGNKRVTNACLVYSNVYGAPLGGGCWARMSLREKGGIH